MKVRLVAYRNATPDTTKLTAYDLDLQEEPNIALNFQFADIKEPEKRKGSYSQTFKLPFTQANDEFFQTWYNVNLQAPVFDTRTRFPGTLFYGTVPQFEGFIQLKAVYLKAELYEITLMSNASNLFTNIGNKKVQDILVDSTTGIPTRRWNHNINYSNILSSWNGSVPAFTSVTGYNFQDSVSNVQEILYPMSITDTNFRFRAGSNEYLDMSQEDVENVDLYPTYEDVAQHAVNITNLRPAVQLRAVLKMIIAQAGFSYSSAFLNGAYFGRLFMTTSTEEVFGRAPVVGSGGEETGQMVVGNTDSISISYSSGGSGLNTCAYNSYDTFSGYNWKLVEANTTSPTSSDYDIPDDPLGLWTAGLGNNFITKTDTNMTSMVFSFLFRASGVMTCGWAQNYADCNNEDLNVSCWPWQSTNYITVQTKAVHYDPVTGTNLGDVEGSWATQEVLMNAGGYNYNQDYSNADYLNMSMNLWNVPIGGSARIYVRVVDWERRIATSGNAEAVSMSIGALYGDFNDDNFGGLRYILRYSWTGYGSNIYNREVDMWSAIGGKMTQKDFLKELISRFNLVIIPDPKDQNKLLIEPYNDFMAGGDIKDWTDKLDTSKEIVIKDTTSLQKRNIMMNDLPDNDLMNRAIAEEAPSLDVYGKIDITVTNNDFAKGEMKNKPLFSPYINQKVFQTDDDQDITHIRNMAVQYEWTTQKVEGGYEKVLETTAPKLFYYCGTTTNVDCVDDGSDEPNRYFLHQIAYSSVTAHKFTYYPLCSPWDLQPTGTPGQSTIDQNSISLYWNQNGPLCGGVEVFNYLQFSAIPTQSLYHRYWAQFFNTIYHEDARLMECYMQLNPVDIINFRFSDQIFIKNNYWRILDIKNYQVGQKVSSKVTFIKQGDVYAGACAGANFVVGQMSNGNNNWLGLYVWCPLDNSSCTPTMIGGDYSGWYTDEESCLCVGGTFQAIPEDSADYFDGAGICKPNENSPAPREKNWLNFRSIFSNTGDLKSILNGKIAGLKAPFVVGSDRTKWSNSLMTKKFPNDIVIKYRTNKILATDVRGESHKLILMGETVSTKRSFAYPEGKKINGKLQIPPNANVLMRVNAIVTVIGGTNATYTVGATEGLSYYTGFVSHGGAPRQLGTIGGEKDWDIRDTGIGIVSTALHITVEENGMISFGLDDTESKCRRLWELTVEYEVNLIAALDDSSGYNPTDYALYQNGNIILVQNGDYLLWN